jgi:hypothetical protein
MAHVHAEVPDEIAGWVDDAARRFEVTPSEIIQRALEHYLGHVSDVAVVHERRRQVAPSGVDWELARKTLKRANCTFDHCPFEDDCPAEICAL